MTSCRLYGDVKGASGLLIQKGSNKIDAKDPSARRAIVIRPTRMDAGIAANKRPIVHGESVRVRRVGDKIHRLKYLAGCGLVLDQPGPAFGVVLTVVSRNLPDSAIVPSRSMISHPPRSLVERDHEFRRPCSGIHSKNSTQPEG